VGDVVKAGTTIGLVASSGKSSGPHLHFEVSHNGRMVETYLAPSAYWVSPAHTDDSRRVPASSTDYYITENGGTVHVSALLRSSGGLYTTQAGTAKKGSDYTGTSDYDAFIPFVSVPIRHDGTHEQPEQFTVKFKSGGETLLRTVHIIDDDHLLNYDFGLRRLTIDADTDQANEVVTLGVVGDYLHIDVNGEVWLFPPNWLGSVDVWVDDGNNTITVKQTAPDVPVMIFAGNSKDTIDVWATAAGGSVTISPGSGKDTINVGRPDDLFPSFASLDEIQGFVFVLGYNRESPTDVLNILDNSLTNPGHTYTVTTDSVQRSGSAAISYGFGNLKKVVVSSGAATTSFWCRAPITTPPSRSTPAGGTTR
jgi:hypothetical protein